MTKASPSGYQIYAWVQVGIFSGVWFYRRNQPHVPAISSKAELTAAVYTVSWDSGTVGLVEFIE